ncbi:uncharacterized protein LOC118192343 isoform X2 [Stegodyphus dumicola]|uniref:uncharacterized protein LOC118192343 isoform X2 n=1 Tax=Stegodyphus dumicola TaxID=202533 RepID=UPI0015AB96BD|nr:uncharacterized protein LOC118192343 isoform X2 [Stegodyphus dumicola]
MVPPQSQSTQVPRYPNQAPLLNKQQVTLEGNSTSPDQYQNVSQQQASHHIIQPLNGNLTSLSDTYQMSSQQPVLQNFASSASIQNQQTIITSQHSYSQNVQNMPALQNQSQSPQKIVPPQQIQTQLSNMNSQQLNQATVFTHQGHPQSPQKERVLSPQQSVKPAVQYQGFQDVNIQNNQTYQNYQDMQHMYVQPQLQAAVTPGPNKQCSPGEIGDLHDKESFDRAAGSQLKQDAVSRQPSVESDGLTAEVAEELNLIPTDGISSDILPDASHLPLGANIQNNVTQHTSDHSGQKYIFVPGVQQAMNVDSQTVLPVQNQGPMQVSQSHLGGQPQPHLDPNFSSVGLSGKPLVGFSASFCHASVGQDTSLYAQHYQNYPYSYTSKNSTSIWNTASTASVSKSSLSNCFFPPNANNMPQRGSSINSQNDGSKSPVFIIMQPPGNVNCSQYHVINWSNDAILYSSCDSSVTSSTPYYHRVHGDTGPCSVRSLPTSNLCIPSVQPHSNSSVCSLPHNIPNTDSVLVNTSKYSKFVTPVGSRSVSPVSQYSFRLENDSPIPTPPPQIISSPPNLTPHLLHPESRVGIPVILSPKHSPPSTPLHVNSRSATPIANAILDHSSQSGFLNTGVQNICNQPSLLNNNCPQLLNPSSQLYRSRSKTFGGTGVIPQNPRQILTSQHSDPRHNLSSVPFSVLNHLSLPQNSSLNDSYRNSFTVIPFERSGGHSHIHLPDSGPFVAYPSSSHLFMSLAVEKSHKLNSPLENISQNPPFAKNCKVEESHYMYSYPSVPYSTTVHRQQKASVDSTIYRPGASHLTTVSSPDSSHEQHFSPVGFRTVSSSYNASQVDQVKEILENVSLVPRVDSSGSLPALSDDSKSGNIPVAESGTDLDHTVEGAKHQKFNEKKKMKRRRTQDRSPKLTVIGVEDTMVECQLESTKGKTVTFKFDYTDTSPEEIANKLIITNLLAENHAEIFTDFIQEVIRQLKENPERIPVIQYLESVSGNCSPPTMRKQTFREHLELEKNLSMDSQDSSLPSTPQDQEKEWSPKKQGSPSRLAKSSAQSDTATSRVALPSANTALTDSQAVHSASDHKTSDTQEKSDMSVVTIPLSKLTPGHQGNALVNVPVSHTSPDIPVVASETQSSILTKMPDTPQLGNQSVMSACQLMSDQAKRVQDLSSSSSGGSTQHSQQQRPVVPDLSSLQLKLAQLTSTSCSMANDAGLCSASNIQGSVQSIPQVRLPSEMRSMRHTCSVPSITPRNRGDVEQITGEISAAATSVQLQITSAHTCSIVTPVPVPVVTVQSQATKLSLQPTENISSRRHTVATNIEGLKLELQKIHTPLVPSVNLKSNIEQGLQAIFSISSTAHTVTTPAHSTSYNHTHQLLSSSTPSLSTPTEGCTTASKTPAIQPFAENSMQKTFGCDSCADVVIPDTSSVPAFSRFKVTPVIESQPMMISSVSESVNNSISAVVTTEATVKKQGRFQITRVADEIATTTGLAQASVHEVLKKDSQIMEGTCSSNANVSSSIVSSQEQKSLEISQQNSLLQHSCSNPALGSSGTEMITRVVHPPEMLLIRSISDNIVSEEQSIKDNDTKNTFSIENNASNISLPQSNIICPAQNREINRITAHGTSEESKTFQSEDCEKQLLGANELKDLNQSLSDIGKSYPQVISDSGQSIMCNDLGKTADSKALITRHEPPSAFDCINVPMSEYVSPLRYCPSLSNTSDLNVTLSGIQIPADVVSGGHSTQNIFCTVDTCSSVASGYSGANQFPVLPHPHITNSHNITCAKMQEIPPLCANLEEISLIQQPVFKDANANPLHSALERGENIQPSHSELESKTLEILECNDEYLKVILERQEQERQELFRRHQQELYSYKMHHLRAHYGGKCCFHGKNYQSNVANIQTGSVPFSGFAYHLPVSKDQSSQECSINMPLNQNSHVNQVGIVACEPQHASYLRPSDLHQNTKIVPMAEMIPPVDSSMRKQSDFGVCMSEPCIRETFNHLHYAKDPTVQQTLRNDLNEICSLPVGQPIGGLSTASISDFSITNVAMPQMQIHDVHTNQNMTALSNKTAVQRSVEAAPHSSPQTVRRIINATSAINVNPEFHQVMSHIASPVSVPQILSANTSSNVHSQVLNVSLPYSPSSDDIVSSPSKHCFSRSNS